MRGQINCNKFCRHPEFPIELLRNVFTKNMRRQKARYIPIASRYTTKHKEQGLARCKICEYVTAQKINPGVACPCCKFKLSTHVRDRSHKLQVGNENKKEIEIVEHTRFMELLDSEYFKSSPIREVITQSLPSPTNIRLDPLGIPREK